MGVVQRTEQVEGNHEVVDLTTYEGATLERGERWGTVLAFAVVGTIAIVAILGLWAAAPTIGS